MNCISQVFNDPACNRDQQAVDLCELHVSPELVQQIRDAPNRETASARVIRLLELVDESDGLSEDEARQLKEWLGNVNGLLNPGDYAGWSHRTGR